MSFNNSQVSFRGKPTFNNYGDQINTRIIAEVVHMHDDHAKVTERTIFGQFEDVKRGHVIGMKDLYSEDLSQWDWHFENGELVHPDRQSKFTAITYKGEDAQEAWEKDFEQFSRASRTGHFQLFGINRSDIPMLIFHHELIPLGHVHTDSLFMNMYIRYLRENKRCHGDYLWLNTSDGVFCTGPYGLRTSTRMFDTRKSVIQALPSTVDMLEEGTSIAFFSKFGSNVDDDVLDFTEWYCKESYCLDSFPKMTEGRQHKHNNDPESTINHYHLEHLRGNLPHHLPMDIVDGLRFDTVYSPLLEPIARWPPEAPGLWQWLFVDGLVEGTQIDGRLTRFKLNGQEKGVYSMVGFDWKKGFRHSWLTQSSRVFNFLKTTGHQEKFFVVGPPLRLKLELYNELPVFSNAVEEIRPIYLFLYSLPMSTSELMSWMDGHTHFWSFDENGRSRILEEEWERWGIPTLTPHIKDYTLVSWPTHVYTALHKWQTARGFDPSTADWARELGYPEFEIVGAKKDDRFEEIPDQPASCDRCLTRNLACLKDTSPETKTIGCIPCGKSRVRCSLNDAVVTRKRKAPEPENTSSGSSKRLKSNDGRRRSTRAKK